MVQFNPMTGAFDEDQTTTTPQSNPWDKAPGDPQYESVGQVHLRGENNDRFGSEWANGQPISGGGTATSFGTDDKGMMRYGVDSLETAQQLSERYGGKIVQGYQGAEDVDLGGGSGVTIPGQSEKGWGYYYVPPGNTPEEQYAVGHEMGVLSDPSFMDKYGFLVAAILFSGGALAAAGGAVAGAGTAAMGAEAAAGGVMGAGGATAATGATSALSAGVGATTAAGIGESGLTASELASFEASALGGPAVGTGTELSAAEMLAASGSEAVQSSVAANSGMTPTDFQNYLNNPNAPVDYPGQGPAQYGPETPGSGPSTSTSGLSSAATSAGKSLLSTVAKSLLGGSPTTPNTGAPNTSNPFNFNQSSNMLANQAANTTPGMTAQAAATNPQTQQIAQALMLGSQNQPQFGAVGYTPVSQGVQPNAQMMALAKALQGDDDNG